jgi:hypothetical protein
LNIRFVDALTKKPRSVSSGFTSSFEKVADSWLITNYKDRLFDVHITPDFVKPCLWTAELLLGFILAA